MVSGVQWGLGSIVRRVHIFQYKYVVSNTVGRADIVFFGRHNHGITLSSVLLFLSKAVGMV